MIKKEKTAVALANKKEAEIVAVNPMQLLAMATKMGADVDKLEKLMALQERWEANEAKKLFVAAMAKFQSECPVIEKTKKVMEKDGQRVRYRYAPLESIIEQVKKPLADNGLSYAFDEDKDNEYTKVICIVTHTAGHSEKTAFKIPIGTEQFMSDVQKHGARMTFGKRYAFCNAFGILTGDEDTDGQNTDLEKSQNKDERFEKAKEMIAKTTDMKALNDYLKTLQKSNRYEPEKIQELIAMTQLRISEIEGQSEKKPIDIPVVEDDPNGTHGNP